MAKHARPKAFPIPGALLRAGVIAAAAGAALGAGSAATASAAPAVPLPSPDLDAPEGRLNPGMLSDPQGSLATGLHHGVAPLKKLRLDPLAGTGVDPLNNAVGTRIADFKPVSSDVVTGPIARGASLSQLPAAGRASGLLPG